MSRGGVYPGFLRLLGKCATREELESLKQELDSVTRIFDFSRLFGAFPPENTQARAPTTPNGATTRLNARTNDAKHTEHTP